MNLQSFRFNQDIKVGMYKAGCLSSSEKKLSLGSLITQNITKVLEACPYIDLKSALQATQERMERDSQDGAPMMSLQPEEQHLAAAVQAWHRLGHQDVASLYEFIMSNSNEYKVGSVSSVKTVSRSVSKIRSRITSTSSFDVKSIASIRGAVVRLPLKTNIVMRVENSYQCLYDGRSLKTKQNNEKGSTIAEVKTRRIKTEVKNQVKAACTDFGIDKEHLPKLAELEQTILDLRTRTANLSRRKAEKIELLERTDVAWKDLELGYERRLKLAEEKAKDTEDQIKRVLDERNDLKTKSKAIVEDLKARTAGAEALREELCRVDAQVCGLACERQRASERAARDDGERAAEDCRHAQIDRELEFKEQAERRKIQYLESEIGTARALTIEAERALRSDVAAVQENLKQITNEINKEKNKNEPLKAEIAILQTQKVALSCDLDNCKMICGDDMQRKIEILKSKKMELAALKEKVIDCQCKLPIDASAEAKRTPSLAANCVCETNDSPISCSCTSLRHQLMSDLLGNLFEGVMSDLCATGSLMPCQLLKCLDDGHDWERDSILRTNIQSYCSQLLISELNIAITTTIENSRTKWLVGCEADKGKLNCGVDDCDLDARAKILAAKLAEQMFKQKADAFTRKALQVVSSRVKPCHCKKENNKAAAIYPLLVKQPTTRKLIDSPNLKRTINDVAQLRKQIEILKKETIGKDDLKVIKDKLARIINRATRSKSKNKNKQNDDKPERDEYAEPASAYGNTITIKKCEYDEKKKFSAKPKAARCNQSTKKDVKYIRLPSPVGIYTCDTQEVSNNMRNVLKTPLKYKSKDSKTSKCIDVENCTSPPRSFSDDMNNKSMMESEQIICPKECICIHKIPSNKSMNEFLESLTKTESYYQNLNIDTRKKNSKDSKLFLNEEARPTISTYMCDINLNRQQNENPSYFESLNKNVADCPESNIIKISCEKQDSSLIKKIYSNSRETNINKLKSNSNINEKKLNEYGKPIKYNSCSKDSRGESAVGSTCQSCVCCNDKHLNTQEIEINALNLLKEHIRDKIKDLRPNLKHPIPADDERNIYNDILKEIKKIITNGTFEQLCKCSFENHEGSRQRAYNLLKEYLKIKIKRAQCSCDSKCNYSDKLMVTILNRITELIDKDFELLKLKYQEKCGKDFKKSDIEIKNIEINENQLVHNMNELGKNNDSICEENKAQEDKDVSAQVSFNFNSQNKSCDSLRKYFNIDKQLSCSLNSDNYFNTNPIEKYAETISSLNKPENNDNKFAQVSFYFDLQNESSGAIENIGKNYNTDKKVSCTIGNDVYVTDCNCRYNVQSNNEETTRFDNRVLYFDINDNFY